MRARDFEPRFYRYHEILRPTKPTKGFLSTN